MKFLEKCIGRSKSAAWPLHLFDLTAPPHLHPNPILCSGFGGAGMMLCACHHWLPEFAGSRRAAVVTVTLSLLSNVWTVTEYICDA